MDSPASPMAEPPSVDQELYRQLAKGREEAFSALYERYQGPIFRFAWHLSGNTATAEDVTQEVFMLLIRSPKNYDPDKGRWPDIYLASRGTLPAEGWIEAASTNPLRRIGRKGTKQGLRAARICWRTWPVRNSSGACRKPCWASRNNTVR